MERVGETEISSVGAEGASLGEVVDAVVDERDLFNCVVNKGIFVLIARLQGPDGEVATSSNTRDRRALEARTTDDCCSCLEKLVTNRIASV